MKQMALFRLLPSSVGTLLSCLFVSFKYHALLCSSCIQETGVITVMVLGASVIPLFSFEPLLSANAVRVVSRALNSQLFFCLPVRCRRCLAAILHCCSILACRGDTDRQQAGTESSRIKTAWQRGPRCSSESHTAALCLPQVVPHRSPGPPPPPQPARVPFILS